MKTFPLLFTVLSCGIGVTSMYGQVSYDFNTSQADVNAKFVSTGNISASWSATAGTGSPASGGLNSDNTSRATYYNTAQSDLATPNQPLMLSLDFKGRNSTTSTYAGTDFSLGLSNGTTSTLAIGSGVFFAATVNDLSATAGDGSATLILQSRNGGANTTVGGSTVAGTASATVIPSFTIVDTNWYRLTLTVTNNGTNFVVGTQLFDIGATGTSTPTSLGSTSNVTVINSGLQGSTSAEFYGFNQIAQNGGGVYSVDNFAAAVPEPSSMALLGLGAVAAVALRKRSTLGRVSLS